METLTETIENLRQKGFIYYFDVINGKLITKQTGEVFTPGELSIEEIHRFEGDSNPDDMSVLYAIKSVTGRKGILIDAFGTYSNIDISEFIRQVSINGEV